MRDKFVGFMWDLGAHKIELRCLPWLSRRNHRVRMGGTPRHEYQVLEPWTWQAFHEVETTLMSMAEVLPAVLMSKADVQWMMWMLRDNAMNTGNMFTATDGIILLNKWMTEYSAYVRTVYWSARPESDKGAVLKGFRDTSELWEAALSLARAQADAQYGEVVRNGRMGGNVDSGGHFRERSPKEGQLLGKREFPGQETRRVCVGVWLRWRAGCAISYAGKEI